MPVSLYATQLTRIIVIFVAVGWDLTAGNTDTDNPLARLLAFPRRHPAEP
jgi:hypothetical protein